jgi:hypothetical protein
LTNHFIVGPSHVPNIGLSTEVIMPWSDKLPKNLIANVTLVSGYATTYNPYSYGNISLVGFIYE